MENQEEILKREILQESKRKADKILERAQKECEQALARANGVNEKRQQEILDEARAEAVKKARKIALDIEYEGQSKWLMDREQCIEALFGAALKRAEALSGAELEKSYRSLMTEALDNLPESDTIVVSINPKDSTLVTSQWLKKIDEKRQYQIVVKENQKPGLVVSADDGRQTFDNTYFTRLRILKIELRKKLASVLE